MTKKDREAMKERAVGFDWCGTLRDIGSSEFVESLATLVEREVDRAVRKARREERKHGMHLVIRALALHDAMNAKGKK